MTTENDSDAVIVLGGVDKVWELKSGRGLRGGCLWRVWTFRVDKMGITRKQKI